MTEIEDNNATNILTQICIKVTKHFLAKTVWRIIDLVPVETYLLQSIKPWVEFCLLSLIRNLSVQ